MPLLEITGLKKTYTTRLGGTRVEALKNVSFTAEQLKKGVVIKKGKKVYHKVTL